MLCDGNVSTIRVEDSKSWSEIRVNQSIKTSELQLAQKTKNNQACRMKDRVGGGKPPPHTFFRSKDFSWIYI